MERIYAVMHTERKECYVGRTSRALVDRWTEHLKHAADGNTSKALYEALRHEPDAFEIVECECSETASEAQWMQTFKAEGYRLLNDTGGNRRAPKKRDTIKERAWRDMNVNAERAFSGPANADPERLNKILAEVQARVGSSAERWERTRANPAR